MSNLATKLRTGTQQSHTAAEQTGFMTKLLKDGVDKNSFCTLLVNLYSVYSQLETEIELNKNHPVVSHLYFPELNRKANLEEDLVFYYGNTWQDKVSPSPAAQAYISRIREISASEPALLIAHSYTRYMGDLSGGQGIKKIAQSVFNLPEHQGIRFYEFDQIADVNEFKGKYRQALNDLDLNETLEEQIVAEANISFSFNISMLKDIDVAQPVA